MKKAIIIGGIAALGIFALIVYKNVNTGKEKVIYQQRIPNSGVAYAEASDSVRVIITGLIHIKRVYVPRTRNTAPYYETSDTTEYCAINFNSEENQIKIKLLKMLIVE